MRDLTVLILATAFSFAGLAMAQDPAAQPAAANGSEGPVKLPKLGVDVHVSTLGPGIEASTAVTQRANIRVGFNFFSYSLTQTKKGLTYGGDLHLLSSEALFDWFPFRGNFHLSPGVLLYNGNHANATVSAPGGTKFTLNGNAYYSSQASPLTGTATLALNSNKVSPAVLFGFGNPLPRTRRHVIYNFEAGVVFMGSPSALLNLNGATCTSSGTQCQSISTNSTIQADIRAQQDKINRDLSFFKYFPVISLGFGYKF